MNFIEAESLEFAIDVLGSRGDEVTVLAGGTDIMVEYLRGDFVPNNLLHVRQLEELRGTHFNGRTKIGSLVTHWDLATDPAVASRHPALAEAASTVGGRQTQNVGTLGGNIANASPAADTLPPLLVADARVGLVSSEGERTLAIENFIEGRKATARQPNELMTSISLEPPGPRTGEVYLKLGRRSAMEVAVVGLAARLTFSESGRVTAARIACCAVAPTVFRATEVELALEGEVLSDDGMAEAGRLLAFAAKPIDDARATAAYRRRVLPPLLRRAAAICRDRAGVHPEQ